MLVEDPITFELWALYCTTIKSTVRSNSSVGKWLNV